MVFISFAATHIQLFGWFRFSRRLVSGVGAGFVSGQVLVLVLLLKPVRRFLGENVAVRLLNIDVIILSVCGDDNGAVEICTVDFYLGLCESLQNFCMWMTIVLLLPASHSNFGINGLQKSI